MQKTILAVLALAVLACLSAFALLEQTTSPANTQALADTARFIAENKFITGEQYLMISNVEAHPNDDRLQLAFDVAWDASWHDDFNWDAAWLFIKGQRLDGTWHHLPIMPGSPTMLHTDGPDAVFENPVDGAGFFVHRKEKGEGDNRWRIAAEVDASGAWSQFRVFGLEMVYVPEGSFNIGTAKATSDRDEVIVPESGGAPYNPFFTYRDDAPENYAGPYRVASEAPIQIAQKDGNLYYTDARIPGVNTYSGDKQGVLSGEFPKGYGAFYAMKYELTQGQYADFLNTLTPTQAQARALDQAEDYGRPPSDYRGTLVEENGQYRALRPHRACHFISWIDGLAFADWAGLRHMTELEFEKAARGPESVVYREYVWGVNEHGENRDKVVFTSTILQTDGTPAVDENGSERVDGNLHVTMFHYQDAADVCSREPDYVGCRTLQGGDGGLGPVRVGVYGAASGGDRVRAGASFYGVMELGGNLQEPVVTVGHPYGRQFKGTHGDGTLTPDGTATNADWQAIDGDYAFGGRGGSWRFSWNHARTSDRFKGLRTKANRRAAHIGFRGVRTGFSARFE